MLHAMIAWGVRSAFQIASYAVLLAGVAALIAWAGSSAWLGPNRAAPSEHLLALRTFALQVGVTYVIAGLALAWLSHSRKRRSLLKVGIDALTSDAPQETESSATTTPGAGWLTLIAVSLAILPIMAVARMGSMWTLWSATAELATRWSLPEQFGGADDTSGLVLVPILAIGLVPVAEIVTCAAFVLCSAGLLLVFPFRSRFFPRAMLISTFLQLALLLTTFYALNLDLVERARTLIEQEARNSKAEDVRLFATWAERHQAAVEPIARSLAWTFAGYVVWLPAVFVSARGRAYFTQEPETGASFALKMGLPLTRMVLNRTTLPSPEGLPAEVRRDYEKAMASIAEAQTAGATGSTVSTARRKVQRIVYNGRVYHSLDELPPEAREHVRAMMVDQQA